MRPRLANNTGRIAYLWPMLILALVAGAAAARADADDPSSSATQRPQNRPAGVNAARAIGDDEVEGPSIFEGIESLNPIDAARDDLRRLYGIYLHGQYIGDPYADIDGGIKRGAIYAGRLDVQLDVDAKTAFGVDGAALHANMFEIQGRDISAVRVGNVLSSNDIAARPTARLYELWVEQRFGDKAALRVGQQGIDVEFLTSDYAANFVDATFGWPGLPSLDLPQGGPAYPLATPAARLKLDPAPGVSILAAVFDGEPAGPGLGDPQARDPSGLNFRVSDPPLFFLETQYRYNRGEDADGLPGTLKLGGFSHLGRFDDQQFAVGGIPLALAGQNATPIRHSPDAGGYAILDQQVYRLPGGSDEKGIGVFARLIGAPPDRNVIDLYADAGFFALGLVPGRPDDGFGLAAAIAKVSSAAEAADRATDFVTGMPAPVRSYEAVIEATYDATIVPGFMLQPTLQYIVHPSGNVANPYGNGIAPIPNAIVTGVTTVVRF